LKNSLTIIIPAFNESSGLKAVLPPLIELCSINEWKIIVINDCSSDNTGEVLQSYFKELSVITNTRNLGYGASIKRGIVSAETTWIATMDADGQHSLEDLKRLAEFMDYGIDAIIGNRCKNSHGPLNRKPGKWILQKGANFITGQKIHDINCGLRIIRRNIMLRLLTITSDRFSFSTSTLICLLQLGCKVRFEPVVVKERIGKSSVNQIRDGFYTLLLIVRMVFLFKPLRIVLPVGLGSFVLAAFNQMLTFVYSGFNVSDATVFLGLSGIIISLMALLADHISGLRRDLLLHDLKIKQLAACVYNKKEN
jgi:glycosyltransferase involved in cell wall biosynthesis